MINWIVAVLFASIIFKEFKILKELVIKTRKGFIEKIFFLIGVGVIFYITYAYGRVKIHYLLGALGEILYAVSYFRTGITERGFSSIFRGARLISWDKVQKVHINKDKNVQVSYSGSGFYYSLYFDNRDYDKIIEFLNKKLPSKSITSQSHLR